MKTKLFLKTLLTSILFSALLFLFAGTTQYVQGWIFFSNSIVGALLNFLFIRNDRELIEERAKVGAGTKSWDKKILALSAFSYLLSVAVAGLDSGRYHWSAKLHWSVYVAGLALSISGQLLFLFARKENRFFSSVVRIQNDRNHTVYDTGPYSIIRHPGYLGMTLSLLAMPFITGSLWSLIPVSISIMLLMVRTEFEDRTLQKELPGYIAYSGKTKKKLIPLLW